MAEILAQLRRQTNGAVTGAMEAHGVVWPLNYGVSVPAIRSVAAEYSPDHELGRLLYRQQIRELCLAGIMIADPCSITCEEIPFWEDGVINSEVAEHISFLLSASEVMEAITDRWLTHDNQWLRYAAVLSVTRRLLSGKFVADTVVSNVLSSSKSQFSVDNRLLWRSFASFLNALYRVCPSRRDAVMALAEELKSENSAPATYVCEELYF
jgi:3-methyladenine DNA glycosylase AlkD